MFLVKLEELMDPAAVPVALARTMRQVRTGKTGSPIHSTWKIRLHQVSVFANPKTFSFAPFSGK
jgi:hypothetical protein